jgi:hypothetical protein
VIFDDVALQPPGVPQTLLLVVIDRPMQSLAVWPVVPVLGRSCGNDRMLDRKHERSVCPEPSMHLAADEIETLDIVQRQRADHDVELVGRKVDVLDR